MNYKDALTHPINDRLTKAKLIEISKSLQDHCLVDELTAVSYTHLTLPTSDLV